MAAPVYASDLLKAARERAGLSQRELARKAKTAQSVVARIELGTTSPSLSTLTGLLAAAGFELAADLRPRPRVDRSQLDDVPRILALTPAERIREVGLVNRFVTAARRV